MILTESKLRELTSRATILSEARIQTRYFSDVNRRLSVFLSHKHSDLEYLERVRYILESLNAHVYVDWADPAMQHPTNRTTAEVLKEKIERYDKFIFIASDAAISSKWCNWEIGYGDAQKYKDRIAILPMRNFGRSFYSGNEYMQIYPHIVRVESSDISRERLTYPIERPLVPGYYVASVESAGKVTYVSLRDWLK